MNGGTVDLAGYVFDCPLMTTTRITGWEVDRGIVMQAGAYEVEPWSAERITSYRVALVAWSRPGQRLLRRLAGVDPGWRTVRFSPEEINRAAAEGRTLNTDPPTLRERVLTLLGLLLRHPPDHEVLVDRNIAIAVAGATPITGVGLVGAVFSNNTLGWA